MIDVEKHIPRPRTDFIKIKCSSCGNEQRIFSAASRTVKCNVCSHVLAEPGSSKIRISKEKKAGKEEKESK